MCTMIHNTCLWVPFSSGVSRDALNTTTPNLADLMREQCTYTHDRWTTPVNQA